MPWVVGVQYISEQDFKIKRIGTIGICAVFVVTLVSAALGWHPINNLKSVLAPKPRLIVLNTIGAAFDQLDFDKTFANAPECHGLTLSRSSEAPDDAIYIVGTVLLDGWSWSVEGFRFEAPPSEAARKVCALANRKSGSSPRT